MKDTVTKACMANLVHFKKNYGSRIINFDFKPGSLVLVRNYRIEESLNRKTKPCYTGPFIVVQKTIGSSYVIAELDRSQSQLRVAAFRVIPTSLATAPPFLSSPTPAKTTTAPVKTWKTSYSLNLSSRMTMSIRSPGLLASKLLPISLFIMKTDTCLFVSPTFILFHQLACIFASNLQLFVFLCHSCQPVRSMILFCLHLTL